VSKNKPPTSRFQEGSTKFPKLVDAAGEAGGLHYENDFEDDLSDHTKSTDSLRSPVRGAHRKGLQKAWEQDSDIGAIERCGHEMRSIFESWRRRGSSNDLVQDLTVVEQKLRMLELLTSSERQKWSDRYASKCQQHASLQRELSECKLSSSKTMTQAFEDVTVMTERIKKTEESYLKCKIDKEHLEFEFQTEISAMSRKLSEMEHAVYTAKVESDKAQREAKGHQQVVKQLEVACKNNDAEKEKLSQKIAVLEEENVFLRTREVQLRQELDGIQAALDQETSQAKAQMNECLLVKQEYESKVVALQLEVQSAKQEILYLASLKEVNESLASNNASLEIQLKEERDGRENDTKNLKSAADFELLSLKSSQQQELRAVKEEKEDLQLQLSRMAQQTSGEIVALRAEVEQYRQVLEQTSRANQLNVEMSTAEKNESETGLEELRAKVQQLTAELSGMRREADASLDEANKKIAALTQETLDFSFFKTHIDGYDQTYSKVLQTLSDKLDSLDKCLLEVTERNSRTSEQTQRERRRGQSPGSPPPAPHTQPSAPVSPPPRDTAELDNSRVVHNLKRWLNRERGLRKMMEGKVRDLRAERDYSRRLLKDFLLQSTRAKAEALASLSFFNTGGAVGGMEVDQRTKREMLRKQVERLREMKIRAEEGSSAVDSTPTRLRELTSGNVLFAKFQEELMELKSETPNSMSDFLLFGHDWRQDTDAITTKTWTSVEKGLGDCEDKDEATSLRIYLSDFVNDLMEEVVAESIIGSETDSCQSYNARSSSQTDPT